MNSPDHANVTRSLISITNQIPLTKSTEMNIFIKEQNLYKCYLTIKQREFCNLCVSISIHMLWILAVIGKGQNQN